MLLCQLQQGIQGFNNFDFVKLRKARILKLFFTAFNLITLIGHQWRDHRNTLKAICRKAYHYFEGIPFHQGTSK